MRIVKLQVAAVVVAVLGLVGSAIGQHSFSRTITVDPSGSADFTTIQGAINFITDPSSGKYTILIFSATYDENITLDGDDENIDLVGIDRDSVIIAPASGNGIVITSGTETSRNNRIANLTIITATGDGIRIVKGGTPAPKDITIEGVTIQANGAAKDGIYASEVQKLRIADVDITTTDGHGIEIFKPSGPGGLTPKDITIEGVTIHADGTGKLGVTGVPAENVTLTNCLVTSDDGDGMQVGNHWTLSHVTVETIEEVGEGSAFDQDALVVADHTFLTITDSTFIGERRSIWLRGAQDILVQNSRLTTSGAGGVTIASLAIGHNTERVLFQNCLIVSDATLTMETRGPRAVFLDGPGFSPGVQDIVLQSCRILAVGDDSGTGSVSVGAVQKDIDGTLTLVDCEVSAINLKETTLAEARGVVKTTSAANAIRVLGGVISTSSAAEKETEVWDVHAGEVGGGVEISGTRLSKWKGPIASAGRPRSIIQRTLKVDSADAAAIVDSADLDGVTITVGSPGILDAYRTVQATWNFATGGDITITVAGTNWADEDIAEAFVLSTTNLNKKGLKPFKTVTSIFIPSASGTLSVGTTNKLGLYYPIASISDVLQQGRKASTATSYTLESPVGTVDATYSTVDVSATITDGDSFEWAILASQ